MTPDQTDAERSMFEAWATDHVDFYPGRLKRYPGEPKSGTPNGEYVKLTVQSMFEAWLARASRVEVTEWMVDAGATAADPDLFSADRHVAHMAASPIDVEYKRREARQAARIVLTAALSAKGE